MLSIRARGRDSSRAKATGQAAFPLRRALWGGLEILRRRFQATSGSGSSQSVSASILAVRFSAWSPLSAASGGARWRSMVLA